MLQWEQKQTSELDKELSGSSSLTDFLKKNHGQFIDRRIDIEVANALLKLGKLSIEEIAASAGLTIDWVKELAMPGTAQ